MKKFYRICLLIIVLIFLSTYNPNKFESNLKEKNTFFKIEKIIISNNLLVNRDDILLKLDKIYGKNIFLIEREDIEESLQNVNFLKKIEVKKKYPNVINVKIFETKPIGILFKDKTQYLIDNSSNLIEAKKKMNFDELPNIIGDGAEKNIANFYEQLEINKFPTDGIKNFYYFKIGRWDLELSDNRVIKLPHNVDNNIIKKTADLLNRKDFKNYKVIDLRIDGKIIVE
jgi:cell division protein FtsQ